MTFMKTTQIPALPKMTSVSGPESGFSRNFDSTAPTKSAGRLLYLERISSRQATEDDKATVARYAKSQ